MMMKTFALGAAITVCSSRALVWWSPHHLGSDEIQNGGRTYRARSVPFLDNGWERRSYEWRRLRTRPTDPGLPIATHRAHGVFWPLHILFTHTQTPNLCLPASPNFLFFILFLGGNSRDSLETYQPPFPAHTLYANATYLNAHARKYFCRKGLLVSSCCCKNGNTFGIGCQAQSATTAAYHTSKHIVRHILACRVHRVSKSVFFFYFVNSEPFNHCTRRNTLAPKKNQIPQSSVYLN